MTSIIEYWKEISVTVGLISTFIFGRNSRKLLEKKQASDAVGTMQKTYDLFLTHYEKQYAEIIERMNKLQQQFINLQLAYAKEIENSQNWEKLHRELEKQYRDLAVKHNDLEKLYEKLKADFESYKKKIKQ